jgi:hypothetical protein
MVLSRKGIIKFHKGCFPATNWAINKIPLDKSIFLGLKLFLIFESYKSAICGVIWGDPFH